MNNTSERQMPHLWWKALFDYQRQTSQMLRTMIPEPFCSSLETIEESIVVPMQQNAEHLSTAILNNSKMFMTWHEEYKEEDKDKRKKEA